MTIKIYYLDDEVDLLENFVDTFSSPKASIQTFSDADDFINACEKLPPDLIFLDYTMPKMSGLEVAKKLHPSLPKILMTGNMNLVEHDIFLRVFEKPLDFIEVEKFISHFEKKH